jgi:hypothetical protein
MSKLQCHWIIIGCLHCVLWKEKVDICRISTGKATSTNSLHWQLLTIKNPEQVYHCPLTFALFKRQGILKTVSLCWLFFWWHSFVPHCIPMSAADNYDAVTFYLICSEKCTWSVIIFNFLKKVDYFKVLYGWSSK